MDKLNDLRDLLKHEIEDLYSTELQITDALPDMIVKAVNTDLKDALEEHLNITQTHRARLDRILRLLQTSESTVSPARHLLSKFFGGTGTHISIGTEGLVREGRQVMKEKMDSQVMDAAIIACAQKIEHYEICGYGTARAYARALGLVEIESMLAATLSEEYMADDLLTKLAVQGGINAEAEKTPSKPSDDKLKISKKKPKAATKKSAPRKKTTNKRIAKS